MKVQFGFLSRDGRPATPRNPLGGMGDDFDGRNAEVSGELLKGPVFMSYRGDRITPEEDSETQPLEHGPYILTWDGRLDSRKELIARLGLRGGQNMTDPEIVLKAYAELGNGVFADLVGEFALCLWCQRARVLTFVRSVCGARTLYYVLDNDRLTWSSNLSHLLRLSEVDLAVNHDYALKYLVSQPDPACSPFQKVRVVPPGKVQRFESNGFLEPTVLWDPQRLVPIQYRSDGEYEERFREEITQAVRGRLRAKGPVFAELSGGLDSSSIVLLGDQILRSNGERPETLRTVSCVYEESQTCDERSFIRSVEERSGIQGFHVSEADQQITLGLGDIRFTGVPNPLHCFRGRYPAFAGLMRSFGSRVLLTGLGGDHLFRSDADGVPLVADSISRLRVLHAHRECRLWSQSKGTPYLQLFLEALRLVSPLRLARRQGYSRPQLPSWLSSGHRTDAISSMRGAEIPEGTGGAPSRRSQTSYIRAMFDQLSMGYFDEYEALYISHPYTHRPLVEFCLSIPLAQFLRNGEGRSLMRRALRDLLPQKVARRKSKGLVDEALARALQREWSQIGDLAQWEVCQRGYIDPERLRDSLNRMRMGLQPEADGSLLRVFSLERWFRSLSHVNRDQGLPKSPVLLTTR